jgi:hypothetical protein
MYLLHETVLQILLPTTCQFLCLIPKFKATVDVRSLLAFIVFLIFHTHCVESILKPYESRSGKRLWLVGEAWGGGNQSDFLEKRARGYKLLEKGTSCDCEMNPVLS